MTPLGMLEVTSDNSTQGSRRGVVWTMTIASTRASTRCVRHGRRRFERNLSVGGHRVRPSSDRQTDRLFSESVPETTSVPPVELIKNLSSCLGRN